VPKVYVDFVEHLLSNRRTTLSFDDYVSDPIQVNNSIGQGDPLSMLLYLFYNADLLQIPASPQEVAAAIVNDVTFLAKGDTFADTNTILVGMFERQNGAVEWS
ncbi:hypothetical protein K488DRAFT_20787, partial [Vararia minispora EC-137]